jgi:hypothetical protein
MNKDALIKVREQIATAPDTFDMSAWINTRITGAWLGSRYTNEVEVCGTVLCIGGWLLLNAGHSGEEINRLSTLNDDYLTLDIAVSKILDVSLEAVAALCYVSGWPTEMQLQIRLMAPIDEVALKVIDAFLKADGKVMPAKSSWTNTYHTQG